LSEPAAIEVHKALADDTRYRLYRYLRLSGRPVSVRELSTRLSLHPNSLRPQLRRLEEVGLVTSEPQRGAAVGRPLTLYAAVDKEERAGRDYRLLADVLSGVVTGRRQQERAKELARDWGGYVAAKTSPKPGARRGAGPDLAALQRALADAGFDPRFHRRSAKAVQVVLRDCPFKDMLEDNADLVCGIHRGLLEGILTASRPPLTLHDLEPAIDGSPCRLIARSS
jgi:predicted ArsR family transcriptional regulator